MRGWMGIVNENYFGVDGYYYVCIIKGLGLALEQEVLRV